MSRFSVTDLPLSGLKQLQRRRLGDHRGFLERLFCSDELAAMGWQKPIVQINLTHTREQGAVRGMHFQHPPHAEMKVVTCIRGEVWDVAVDLRRGSPTFLNWHAQRLSSDNLTAMLIPEGFAHGFQTMTEDVELLYFHSAVHVPEAEAGLNPRDLNLAIDWPLPIKKISERDNDHPMIDQRFKGIQL